tara:strand:- start:823 stop:996 length:174 start_codon:yes stop_codon:yes gene_type:complete
MASGDLTASTPVYCEGAAAVKTAVDALNLAATTDHIFVVPVGERNDVYIVFKVERAA